MGLEHIELGIRVEEEFGVFIEDEDYESLKTVGDLVNYIDLHSTRVWPCPHIPAFHRLRAGLSTIAGRDADEIVLETQLRTLMKEPTHRRCFWSEIEKTTGLRL